MDALRECPRFENRIVPGKRALDARHRARIVESTTIRCEYSLNFEAAVDGVQPHLARWDYMIQSSAAPGRVHAVEVHQYSESQLRSKLNGTRALLEHCCSGSSSAVVSWNVIVEGAMPRIDIAARFRARTGINIAGHSLKLSEI